MFAKYFTFAALVSTFALAAPLTSRSSTTCSASSQTQLDNTVCPAVISTADFLYYQSDSSNTEVDTILGAVVDLIKSSAPNADIGTIISAATEGVTGNLLIGVTEFLYAAASTIQELDPNCRCNAELCYNDLRNAQGNSAAGTTNTQASCAEAKYACGPFYTSDQINKMAPGCAKYNGATNA